MSKAYLRLMASAHFAAHTPEFEKDELPSNSAQYASDIDKQADMRPEGHKESLYRFSKKVKSSKGGITDAEGDESINLETQDSVKPNAQRMLNGCVVRATLRLLADRLSTESDPLTKDQENYGTGSHLKAGVPELIDPATNSTYGRENNSNRNTTEPEVYEASSTVDNFEPATGYNVRNQEGLRVYSKDVHDGDFDPAGRTTGDRLITQDPKTDGYLNIHSAVEGEGGESEGGGDTTSSYPLGVMQDSTMDTTEDAELAAVADEESYRDEPIEEVDADADPTIFNMANQPMGMSGSTILAADRRTTARRLYLDIVRYLPGVQLNNIDSSLGFKCEVFPVLTVLKRLGFEQIDTETLEREDIKVRVRSPRDGWNPVLNIIN